MLKPLLLAGCLLAVTGCATTDFAQGPISRNALLHKYEPFADNYRRAPVDRSIADVMVSNRNGPVTVKIVFGSWCSDSQAGVPVVLRLLDAVPAVTTELLAVDREKKDPEGQAATLGIQRVPTVIVEQGGREIGRIVEFPKTSWRDDLLAILNRAEPQTGTGSAGQ